MGKIDLSIISANFNTFNLVVDCIESIKKNTRNIKFEIIVVNNYPQDNDYQRLKKLYGEEDYIKIMKSKNYGFGTANNLGVKKACGEYLLFLNSDTKVIDNSIIKMVEFLRRHNEIGALNPLLCHPDKSRQKHYFGDFQSLGSVVLRKPRGENYEKDKEFFYRQRITGAVMMIKKSKFIDIGGFDEKFFMYFEDEDLCRRLLNNGMKNAILTSAEIIHLEGKSSLNKTKKRMYYQSQNYYWIKHRGLFIFLMMRFLRLPYILWQKIMGRL